MKFLGLDIATTTGAALLQGRSLLYVEAFRSTGDTPGEIAHNFRAWLWATVVEHEPDLIAAEAPLPTGWQATKMTTNQRGEVVEQKYSPINQSTIRRLNGLYFMAESVAYARRIPFQEINQGTWRKSFLGNGKPQGDKKAMAVLMCRAHGWDVKSKDAAEACGVAYCAQEMAGLSADRPRLL